VRAFDPVAIDSTRAVIRSPKLSFAKNAFDAAAGADATIVATEWNEFRNLDLGKLKSSMSGDVLLDARNVYDPAAASALGFRYLGVGRAAAVPVSKRVKATAAR
jgi:UDPglucose 6-dehydrogenase